MKDVDYGVDFSSSRPDALGLAARLDLAYPEYARAQRFSIALHGTHVPYRRINKVRRINIGPRGDGETLPKLGADLEIVSRNLRCGRLLTFLLRNFSEDDQPVDVGRPISIISQYGASAFDYEAFSSFRMQANTGTGGCVLEGMVCDDEGFEYVELGRSGVGRPNGDPQDAYRFGNSCMIALGATSLTPTVWVPEA